MLTLRSLRARLANGIHRLAQPRFACAKETRNLFDGKVGLELGGPSPIFRSTGLLPVYPLAARVDNINFSAQTVWEGAVEEGQTYQFSRRRAPGRQWVSEASDLGQIDDSAYEFVLSSHTLEHMANPLGALAEWRRVLTPGGTLVLVVPHKDGTFDRHRPVTLLSHLVEDAAQETLETDTTHLEEILNLHDLSRDPGAGGADAFRARSLRNHENRCLHHHVFNMPLAVAAVEEVGLEVVAAEAVRPYHILVVARNKLGDNERFLGADAALQGASPFASDRHVESA